LLPPEEQWELAQLNFRAGQYCYERLHQNEEAAAYARQAIRLMERLDKPFAARCASIELLALAEYMCGRTEEAHRHMAYVMSHRDELSRDELIRVARYQVEVLTLDNNEEAIRVGKV